MAGMRKLRSLHEGMANGSNPTQSCRSDQRLKVYNVAERGRIFGRLERAKRTFGASQFPDDSRH
jgi:hypothetical protein